MAGSDSDRTGPPSSDELVDLGRAAGLAAVGVTSAVVLQPARDLLKRRKAAGLAGDMQFTYRNPDRSTDPRSVLPSARSLVAGAWSYASSPSGADDRAPSGADDRAPSGADNAASPTGRVARYAQHDHYGDLRAALEVVAERLRADGFRAVVTADANHLVDRNAAWLAGLGWYGKNANLLLPGTGSWVVLGAVVTDAELEPSGGPVPDGCGPCTRCLDGCPTGAIVSPGVIDANRCLAWLVQADGTFPRRWREALGDRIYGCDDCQEVCPPNRLAASTDQSTGGPTPPVEPDQSSVDLLWLLTSSDEEILQRHGRWYIARRDVDNIRRTALVALGNTAEPDDPGTVEVLTRHLNHQRPVLRAHAVWAARRLGLDHLAEACRQDPDPAVRAEFTGVVPARFHRGTARGSARVIDGSR